MSFADFLLAITPTSKRERKGNIECMPRKTVYTQKQSKLHGSPDKLVSGNYTLAPACTGGGNLVTSRCKQAASEGSQKLPCTSHGCTEQCSPEVTACLELITFQDLLP